MRRQYIIKIVRVHFLAFAGFFSNSEQNTSLYAVPKPSPKFFPNFVKKLITIFLKLLPEGPNFHLVLFVLNTQAIFEIFSV